jgi:hypothetical protein
VDKVFAGVAAGKQSQAASLLIFDFLFPVIQDA